MATNTCGAEEARAKLPSLLEQAHRGSATVITRHGKPYAALVPVEVALAHRQGASVLSLKGTGMGLWGDDAVRRVADMRNEWE